MSINSGTFGTPLLDGADGAVLYMFALGSKCEICSGLSNNAGLQINNILIIFKEFNLSEIGKKMQMQLLLIVL